LRYLVEHAGRLVTKDELLEAVWGLSYVSEAALMSCIRDIRRVLGEQGRAPQFVETVRGRGYRFIASVTTVPQVSDRTSEEQEARVSAEVFQPPVGQKAALGQLTQSFLTASEGTRQIVFITGEVGIGKTTLVDAFMERLPLAAPLWVGRGQCIDHYGAGEAYLPLLEAFGQMCRSSDGLECRALLRQHAPSWLLQMPALLSPKEYADLQHHSSNMTRESMLRELAEAIEVLSTARTLVLILEDLHWSDVSTIDWVAYVARRRAAARLLVLGTYRSIDARIRAHPVHAVIQELQLRGFSMALNLEGWSEADIAHYLAQWGGNKALPNGLVSLLHQRSHGNPLYI
ncbi:MAG: hypothetical protein ETSY2_52215, partial [Candidatus Entotheonella gemina]